MRAASLKPLSWIAGLLACVSVAGCFGTPSVYAPGRAAQTPPLTWRDDGGIFELTMQAPNPGWRLEYDTVKASKDGPRLLFTVYRPDPGMIYTAQVVDKTVRTDQPCTPGTRVWARTLDHGEKDGRYAPTDVMVPQAAADRVEPE